MNTTIAVMISNLVRFFMIIGVLLVQGTTGRKYLKINDQKKELLKTSGGKYVAPEPIENRILEEF